MGARAVHGEDPDPTRQSSSASLRKSPAEGGQGRSRTLRRRCGWCGTPWSTGSRRATSCRSSMLFCRRWRTSWLDILIPEQAIEVPKISSSPVVLADAWFLRCRRRNSFRKCPWSRMLTFQYLMVVTVEAEGEVFKVYAQKRTQRFVEQNTLTIPVLHGRAGGRGLQGFSPRQNSAASSAHSPGATDEVFTTFFKLFLT